MKAARLISILLMGVALAFLGGCAAQSVNSPQPEPVAVQPQSMADYKSVTFQVAEDRTVSIIIPYEFHDFVALGMNNCYVEVCENNCYVFNFPLMPIGIFEEYRVLIYWPNLDVEPEPIILVKATLVESNAYYVYGKDGIPQKADNDRVIQVIEELKKRDAMRQSKG